MTYVRRVHLRLRDGSLACRVDSKRWASMTLSSVLVPGAVTCRNCRRLMK